MSTLPAPLATAIDKASAAYKVPKDLLVGIWQIESGSSYPNPYANGLGYGGEFGTRVTAPFGSASDVKRVVEPPVQQQANTAASILANLLRRFGGSVPQALSAYSGGGYTSVPGETSPSVVPLPNVGGRTAATTTLPNTGQDVNAQDVSLGGAVRKGVSGALKDIPGVAGAETILGLLGGVKTPLDVFKKVLDDPEQTLGHALLYVLLLVLGVALIYQGVLRATGSSRTPAFVGLAGLAKTAEVPEVFAA